MKNTEPYTTPEIPGNQSASAKTMRSVGRMFGKLAISFLVVFGLVVAAMAIFLTSYIMGLKSEIYQKDMIDLNDLKLNYTSFIYVMDENGEPVEYQKLYGGESNRIWVDFEKIPDNMKNAMIAIEDRRFRDHNGVDWIRTFGATTKLFSKSGSYGGSTITQQLIKNITGDNDVSLTRKVKEIFRAMRLEEKYTKEQILEAYLNIVNYGAGTKGVQAAANIYFDKDISECDLAECAAIAGITQNPYKYNPLQFPEKNKERQQIVLDEMLEQNKITQSEFDQAMEKSEHMTFVGHKENEENKGGAIFNWYTETMFSDLVADLQNYYNCTAAEASNMIYTNGFKIYSAMDTETQKIAEDVFKNSSYFKNDPALQAGFFMMDYNGRVLAVVGSSSEKTGNRVFNYAIDATRQTGSTQKPISVYAPAFEKGLVNYSTLVTDQPVPGWNAPSTKPGPRNHNGVYSGKTTVAEALRNSLNAPAAWLCREMTPEECYKFLVNRMGFTNLTAVDSHAEAAMSIGGLYRGVTVREMTAAFAVFGNQGNYRRPYTYYYVEDHNGNIIIDNRSRMPTKAVSTANAAILNKLLTYAVNAGTGTMAKISGWEVYGKTGTTDSNSDSWFIGGTPYAVAGVWNGYKNPATLKNANGPKALWREVMTQYLKNKPKKSFDFGDTITAATFCNHSGLLASGSCTSTNVGWYEKGKLPATCSAYHTPVASSVEPSGDEQSSSVSSSSPSSGTSSSGGTSSGSTTPSSSAPVSSSSPASSSGGGQAEPPAHGGEGQVDSLAPAA